MVPVLLLLLAGLDLCCELLGFCGEALDNMQMPSPADTEACNRTYYCNVHYSNIYGPPLR
jgi:hypothetical protein